MNNKRKTLQTLVGIGAVASIVPGSWVKPIMSSVVLPAHAQTSVNAAPIGQDIEVSADGAASFLIDLAPLYLRW